MEEKESTVSVSPGNSGTDSPVSSAVPQVVTMAMNANLERSILATPGGGVSMDLLGKKKRGRPRKYDSDGNLRLTYSAPPAAPLPLGFSLTTTAISSPSEFSAKRGRGRPPGSGNWQLLASLGELFANTAGGDFTPHVVTVNTGEDVASKILSFSQKGPRGICILSANGAISNVTIRQPGSSGGILTYEGRFEILSLSGSFTVTDNGGVRSRTGGLSVSLAGPDGRVIGGGIAGLLTAASPIQIIVGSFMPNGYKAHKRKHHREPLMPSPIMGDPDTVTSARPISQAPPESCLAAMPPMPLHSHRKAEDSSENKDIPNARSSDNAAWNESEPTKDQKPYPDINVSLANEL